MIYKNRPNFLKPSFKKWFIKTLPYGRGGGGAIYHRWRRYGTYSLENFIKDDNGTIIVDKVIKLEDFNTELPLVFKNIGIKKIKILKKNVGKKRKKTQDYYDKDLISIIKNRYSWELKKFNYKLL